MNNVILLIMINVIMFICGYGSLVWILHFDSTAVFLGYLLGLLIMYISIILNDKLGDMII